MTSSANHPGKPPANTIAEAQDYFGERIALYVDGGDCRQRPPSTVVRLAPDGSLQIVRQGAMIVAQGEQSR